MSASAKSLFRPIAKIPLVRQWDGPAVLRDAPWEIGVQQAEGALTMSRKPTDRVTTIGIDIGKNSFHFICLDGRLGSCVTSIAGPNGAAQLYER